jgi:two-component system response regulator YesN
MVRVLIADDEPVIRDGLATDVHWADLGIELVGVAADGKEAKRLFLEHSPELLITDVRMPHMDGLELIEEVKQVAPETRCVVISGHEEFAFAQRSLQLGVDDYILKPINLGYLEGILRGLSDQIVSPRRSEEESRAARIRRFLEAAIFGGLSGKELREAFCAEDPLLLDCNYVILCLEIDRLYSLERTMEPGEVENLLHHFFRLPNASDLMAPVYRIGEHTSGYSLCLFDKTAALTDEHRVSLLDQLRRAVEARPYTFTASVSKTVIGPSRLKEAYRQASALLEDRFVHGGNRTFLPDSANRGSRMDGAFETRFEGTEFARILREGDGQAVSKLTEDLITDTTRSTSPRAALSWLATELFREAVRTLSELELSIEEVVEEPVEFLRDILEAETVAEATERTKTLVLQVYHYIQLRRDNHKSAILGSAKEYVDEHFSKRELSLEEVASVTGMSPSYFAVVFKQVTGQTFNRYLTRLRINRAKDLLLYSDLRSYEIAEAVGYESASYFARVFRKVEGITPSDYKSAYA